MEGTADATCLSSISSRERANGFSGPRLVGATFLLEAGLARVRVGGRSKPLAIRPPASRGATRGIRERRSPARAAYTGKTAGKKGGGAGTPLKRGG